MRIAVHEFRKAFRLEESYALGDEEDDVGTEYCNPEGWLISTPVGEWRLVLHLVDFGAEAEVTFSIKFPQEVPPLRLRWHREVIGDAAPIPDEVLDFPNRKTRIKKSLQSRIATETWTFHSEPEPTNA